MMASTRNAVVSRTLKVIETSAFTLLPYDRGYAAKAQWVVSYIGIYVYIWSGNYMCTPYI